jgi:ATP-dependent exoDNAse (exonuclease V) alpha subunit
MAFTRDDVKALNKDIRTLHDQTGQLGKSQTIATESGKKPFAVNDRIRFLRNERDLGAKNGSLVIVEGIESGVLPVKLDDTDTRVHVDTKFYKHLDHGHAATVHKAHGTTVDRSYVLATTHFDRYTAYVARSRHRDNATVFYARDDFGGRAVNATDETVCQRFNDTLSRARPKELAHDYLERETGSDATLVSRLVVSQWEKERKAEPGPEDELER